MMIRNDIDVIGVRAGCTFTGYSDSSFNGQRMTIRAEGYDRFSMMMMMATIMMPLGTPSTNKKNGKILEFFPSREIMVYFAL